MILVRHGETLWEQENRYLGWIDVPLISNKQELQHIGNILLNQKAHIDIVLMSVLERSIVSAWTIMNSMYHSWIPEIHDWRLNPRHYGVIQGLTYQEALLKYPNINEISTSWDNRPDPIDNANPYHSSQDKRYAHIPTEVLPAAESLEDVCKRVDAFIDDTVLSLLKNNQNILIVAHHDSIRAFLRYFKKLSIEDTIAVDVVLSQAIVLDYNIHTDEVVESRLQ